MKATAKRSNRLVKPAAVRPLLLGLLILAVVVAILVPLYVLRNTMLSQVAGTPTNVGTGTHAAAVTPGSLTTFVCQVTSLAANNRMNGLILQENSDPDRDPDGNSHRAVRRQQPCSSTRLPAPLVGF